MGVLSSGRSGAILQSEDDSQCWEMLIIVIISFAFLIECLESYI